MELEELSTRALLRLYADILTELIHRGVVRSRNAPAGDLAEYLVANAFGGELAPPSEKSWDVRVGESSPPGEGPAHRRRRPQKPQLQPIPFLELRRLRVVLLDAHTYDVATALEVPAEGVQELAREVKWVKGFRISTRADLRHVTGAVDRTAELRQALAALG